MMVFADLPPSHYEWQIPTADTPHLILHFDMNKTMIASDKEGQKSPHDVICALLADKITDKWDDTLESEIDYFHYVKYHLLPNPQNSKEIKLRQKEIVAEFLEILKEREHPAYAKAQEVYDHSMRVLKAQKTEIFPSFHKLIGYLHDKKIAYTLVIRTFGSEAPYLARELNAHFGSNFIADFRTIRQGNLLGTEMNLYELVRDADHHIAIRDDWEWWFSHGENWEYGKPFPIDLEDSTRISLFFDDNARSDPFFPLRNIIAPYEVHSGKPLHPDNLIQIKRVFPVDMLDALCDEDYYIRSIDSVLSQI